MKAGGMDVTPQSIAKLLGVKDVESVEKAIQNGFNKKRLNPSIMGPATGNDALHRLVVDVVDAHATGTGMSIERVMQRTGLTDDEIHSAINANTVDTFKQYVEQLRHIDPDRFKFKFRPEVWYGGVNKTLPPGKMDLEQIRGLATTEERNEARMEAIYQAAKDSTQNFSPRYAGTLNGQMLADQLGIDRPATVTDTIRNNQHDPRMRQVLAFFKRDLQIQMKK